MRVVFCTCGYFCALDTREAGRQGERVEGRDRYVRVRARPPSGSIVSVDPYVFLKKKGGGQNLVTIASTTYDKERKGGGTRRGGSRIDVRSSLQIPERRKKPSEEKEIADSHS